MKSLLPTPNSPPAAKPAEPPWVGSRSAWTSAATNTGLSLVQIASGVALSSQALLADGIHSLSDVGADLIVIFAGHHAQKAPDHDHAYGHKRFETGASLALGILLIIVGAGLVASACSKLFHPETIAAASPFALGVAALSLGCKEALFRHLRSAAIKAQSSLMTANAWHARSDAASSLVVLLGLVASLMGYPLLDPVAATIVGAIVAATGWGFSWNALHDLMDRTADEDEVESIRQTILGTPGVLGVHDVKARKMGDLLLVDAHIEVDGRMSVSQAHRISVDSRARVLREHRALDLMTHIDPHEESDDDHSSDTPSHFSG